MAPDFTIEVDDGDGLQALSVSTRAGLTMDAREAGVFVEHVAITGRAMQVGASYFVAVCFARGDEDEELDGFEERVSA